MNKPVEAPSIVIPLSFYTLRCGKCGSTDFKVKILPQNDQPVVQAIRCSECANTWRIDNKRFMQGAGKMDFDNLFSRTKGVIPNG